MKFKSIYFAAVILALAACGEEPKDQPQPVPEVNTLTIEIDHTIDNGPIVFRTQEYTLPAGTVVKPSRLAYLLSNFHLLDTDGNKVDIGKQYALIDVDDNLTSITLTDIPKGDYNGFGFSLGLDSAVNHADPNQYPVEHPLSSVNNALHWSWTAGYIFIAIEGKLASNNNSYVFHYAGDKQRIDYSFDHAFTKDNPALTAKVQFTYEEIFKNPNLYDMEVTGMSIHSETGPVVTALYQNMHNIFEVLEVK